MSDGAGNLMSYREPAEAEKSSTCVVCEKRNKVLREFDDNTCLYCGNKGAVTERYIFDSTTKQRGVQWEDAIIACDGGGTSFWDFGKRGYKGCTLKVGPHIHRVCPRCAVHWACKPAVDNQGR